MHKQYHTRIQSKNDNHDDTRQIRQFHINFVRAQTVVSQHRTHKITTFLFTKNVNIHYELQHT